MDRVFIVLGIIRGHSVVYGYFKSQEGAAGCLALQSESFSSKGFLVEIKDAIPAFNEHGEIAIWDGCEYYGHILND